MNLQLELFPEYRPEFYAYEMDWFGAADVSWEVYIKGEDDIFAVIDANSFGDWLDYIRDMGYDVRINTLESWEAMNA